MSDLDKNMKGGRLRHVGAPQEPDDAVRLKDLHGVQALRISGGGGSGFPLGGGRGSPGVAGTQGNQGNQGNQGWQGPAAAEGTQGNQGPQGNQGAQGSQGFQGNQGGSGPQGFQGNQGNQGLQGFQGNQGNQGNQGPAAAEGTQGNQGPQGNQGRQGPQGNQGLQGVQGPQGNQGLQGVQGPQGLQGVQGPQGNQGLQGVQGPQGNQGLQGVQGPQGNQGLQGVQGPQGNQGLQGVQGPQGNQGLQGVQGPQGNQGLQGVQGPQGNQGLQGVQGPQGSEGFQGRQGFQGLQGPQGFQGVQGPQGFQGVQGPQGRQGFQGFQGIDGSLATLDSAYDGGGAGAGRTITVDAGPVQLTGAGAPATPGHLTLNGSQSITSAAGATWKAFYVTPDVTVTGATNITTAAGFNMIEIDAPTISAASAIVITTAASLYIGGAPVGGGAGPATITNAWAIRVASGNVVFEGALNIGTSITDAVAPGDFSAGLTGGNKVFWDQSTARMAFTSGGVKTIELNAAGSGFSTPLLFLDAQASETGMTFQGSNYPAILITSSSTSGGQIIFQANSSTTAERWSFYMESSTLITWNNVLGDIAFWFHASGSYAINDPTYRTVRFNVLDGANPQIRASFNGTNYGQFTATSVGALRIDTSGVAGVIFNEAGADRDLRAEGDSLPYHFFLDGSDDTENAAFFATGAPDWQLMDRGIFIGDVETEPTGNPTAGGFLYSKAGSGIWLGSGGTSTNFGPAGPHCGICGYDAWTVACFNENWKSWHYECANCGEVYKGGPRSVFENLSPQQRKEILRPGMAWEEVYSVVHGGK